MKKLMAFMMAFVLCFALLGTFGFESAIDHDHSAHVLHAADPEDDFVIPEYIFVDVGSAVYDEIEKTFTVTFDIGSDTMDDIRSAKIVIRTPNRILGKPTIQGGHCFGMWADECAKVSRFNNNLSEIVIELKDDADNAESASGNIVVEYEVNESYFSFSRETYIQFEGSARTIYGDTINYDPITSKAFVYVCAHGSTETRISKKATCLTVGEEETYCTECDYVLSTKDILLADHKYDYTKPVSPKINPYLAPTCTSMGYGSFECLVCKKINSATVPALGHSWGERYERDGSYWVRCTVCRTEEYAENQCSHDRDAYKQISVVQKSTCTTEGIGLFQCPEKNCNQIEERKLPLADHKASSWQVRVEPTCSTVGKKTGFCSTCGETVTVDIPTTEHQLGAWEVATPATCLEPGTQVKKCTVCKKAVETQPTEALGHYYTDTWTVVTPSTCVTPGIQSRSCQRAGCNFKDTVNLPLGEHNYGGFVTVQPATCTTLGLQVNTCRTCSARLEEPIAMVPHTYGEFVVVTEATCMASGLKVKTCTAINCNHQISETIAQDPNNHKYVTTETIRYVNCVSDGLVKQVCEHNNAHIGFLDIPATGHTLGSAFEGTRVCQNEHTALVNGVETKVHCDYKETVTNGKKGTEKEYLSEGSVLSITGDSAGIDYYWVFGAMDKDVATKVHNSKTPFTFENAYAFNLTVGSEAGGAPARINEDMSLKIQLPAEYDGYAADVKVWRDACAKYPTAGFYPVNTAKTDRDNFVTISGDELDGVKTIYISKGEELKPDFFSPEILIPVGITIAVVAIAATVIIIVLVKKGKKKNLDDIEMY